MRFQALPLMLGAMLTSESSASGTIGTWIPSSYASSSLNEVFDTVLSLHNEGVNRIYVDVWNNGHAYFASQTLSDYAGPGALGDDRLAWYSDAVQALNARDDSGSPMELHAWFEYGLMACYGSSTEGNAFASAAEDSGWILGASGGWMWMDPSSGATDLLAEMLKEALSYPAVSGVQLDDHFACPVSLACDVSAMDRAARTVVTQAEKVSLAPAPLTFALDNYNVNWTQWVEQSYFEEYTPQLYTASAVDFNASLTETLAALPPSTTILAGIRVDGSGSPTSWNSTTLMLDAADHSGVAPVIWYAHGILDLYPTEFQERWAGPTAGDGHRALSGHFKVACKQIARNQKKCYYKHPDH